MQFEVWAPQADRVTLQCDGVTRALPRKLVAQAGKKVRAVSAMRRACFFRVGARYRADPNTPKNRARLRRSSAHSQRCVAVTGACEGSSPAPFGR